MRFRQKKTSIWPKGSRRLSEVREVVEKGIHQMLAIRSARKASTGDQCILDVATEERGIRWVTGRTDTTSIRFVKATRRFVVTLEDVVNDTTEFTEEEHDF